MSPEHTQNTSEHIHSNTQAGVGESFLKSSFRTKRTKDALNNHSPSSGFQASNQGVDRSFRGSVQPSRTSKGDHEGDLEREHHP